MHIFLTVTGALNEGFLQTLKLFVITLIGAVPLGLVVSFGSMSRFTPLRWLTRTVVWIIRGTPLMLQLIIIYYIPGRLLRHCLRILSISSISYALFALFTPFSCLHEYPPADRLHGILLPKVPRQFHPPLPSLGADCDVFPELDGISFLSQELIEGKP